MQALVLVGGQGTRLRPLTLRMPKPVLPLVDRPFMRYMVDWLARHGVEEIVMACGFLPDRLREALGDEIEGGPRLRYVAEPEPRGTAGAIKYAEDLLEDRFLALNGDVLTDLDLSRLIARHEQAGARATLGLYPVDDVSGYGVVRRAADGEILEFLEKPDPADVDTDEISAGAYVLEKEILELVPHDREVSIEREVFPRLVGDGAYAERLEGYWVDIGTPERYLDACADILERRVETEPGSRVNGDGVHVCEDAELDAGATLEGPAWIDRGARLQTGCRIAGTVIGPGAQVGERAEVEGSALFANCRIGAGASVEGAILAAGVTVADGAVVPAGAVVGEGATIGEGASLEPGARVDPGESA